MRKKEYQRPLTEVQVLNIENLCDFGVSEKQSGNESLSRDGGFVEEYDETEWEE